MKKTAVMRAGFGIEAFGLSDVGREREVNEDAFALAPERGMFIVADGIGGAEAGDIASRFAIEVVPRRLAERLPQLRRNAARMKVESLVREVLQEANDALVHQVVRRLNVSGMGTTIVLALLWKGSVLIAHLGDSRAGLCQDGELTWLTEDHSLAAQLVRWGKITESQAENNPGRSTLLRYLGMDEQLKPGFTWVGPTSGCRLLLCTDGLTNMVGDEQIARIVGASETSVECCKALIARANQAGGRDNVTVVTVRFEEAANCSVERTTRREDCP